MYLFNTLICGLLFGLGLTISNMTNPNKVLNFLDIFGSWDPTLLVVMVGGLCITLPGYYWVLAQSKPKCDSQFHLPQKTQLEWRLIVGSALFGSGWGLSGYCPGPGVTALATLNSDPLIFIISLLAGSGIYAVWQGRQ